MPTQNDANSSVGHVSSVAPSHTPGPWEAINGLVDSADGIIGCAYGEHTEGNAILFAASLELLAALKLHQLVIELKATTNYADVIRLLEAAGDYESGHTSYEQILSDYTVRAALATESAISKAERGQ